MNDLIFISAQPSSIYFVWQVEVQIHNFKKFDLDKNMHVLVFYRDSDLQDLDEWKRLQRKYTRVNFFFYKDEGAEIKTYIPVIRPHILKQHFRAFPELSRRTFFYHDSDIIFNYLPNFDNLLLSELCWQSNCSSYLDYSYLKKKEEEGKMPENTILNKMAEIGGISIETIQKYDKHTGGAQTILKNLDEEFWQNVEDMSLKIIKAFAYSQGGINKEYFKSEAEGLQSWCADMWALNFAQWKRGINTDVTSELDFSWATESLEIYNKRPIYHNAGVTQASKDEKNLFYKGEWRNRSPIGQDILLPAEDTANRKYVEEIMEIK